MRKGKHHLPQQGIPRLRRARLKGLIHLRHPTLEENEEAARLHKVCLQHLHRRPLHECVQCAEARRNSVDFQQCEGIPRNTKAWRCQLHGLIYPQSCRVPR